MGNGKRGRDGWRCQGRRLGHHITALCGTKAVAVLLVLIVVVTGVAVVVVVVSFGELDSFTTVVTLEVVVVTSGEV